MPEEATQVLAQFAAALTYDQLPDRIKDHCKNLLLDALACALAGHQGEETAAGCGAGIGPRAIERKQRDRRRPPLARRRDAAQRLSHHRRHHVRRASFHHDPRHSGGDPARLGDRRARRRLGPRPARGDCRRQPRSRPASVSGSIIRRSAPAASTDPACSARSARRRRSDGCAASTPRPWRRRSALPAARPPARSRRGERRR